MYSPVQYVPDGVWVNKNVLDDENPTPCRMFADGASENRAQHQGEDDSHAVLGDSIGILLGGNGLDEQNRGQGEAAAATYPLKGPHDDELGQGLGGGTAGGKEREDGDADQSHELAPKDVAEFGQNDDDGWNQQVRHKLAAAETVYKTHSKYR